MLSLVNFPVALLLLMLIGGNFVESAVPQCMNGAGICLAAAQCDANGKVKLYGEGLIDARRAGDNGGCPSDTVCCETSCRCVKKEECNVVNSTNVFVVPSEFSGNVGHLSQVSELFDLRLDEGCDLLETCCEEQDIVAAIAPSKRTTFDQCGVRNQQGIGYRLVGDKIGIAEYGEFPWTLMLLRTEMVFDVRKEVYICAASLIAPNVALTAAHCLREFKNVKIYVRAGEWDTSSDKEKYATQTRQVKEIINHEGYNEHHHNNVALLVLDAPFNADENIQTICLPPPNSKFDGQECFTGAWGKDDFNKGKIQNILRRVEVPILAHRQCQEDFRKTRLGPLFVLDKSYICAGGEEKVDVCTGDGGAPLVCASSSDSERYYQVGIVAWGIGCGQKGVPGAYTNVPMFVDWIQSKLQSLGVPNKGSQWTSV